ncbi:ParB/RepB/Spo0J family partition protein (plasmid) [Methylocystis sp. MJC1]|uniref:ParB/RepB/Spo0J family partition protein n=1 Tax=Methylocystis sp. MJC1 TaxID=2654282 RepID=UPI0013EAD883|nr:ParB/RepB/Spo0J family partition protein [Methylocystis sp. MJC1]KAF2988928.1 Chromosome-partitioning protein Spo0J [Methylocystis sp. MJC1]MBU6529377.1 ParB N-terminal domain-containing protein [Methylocystis sp. MJC1]UZX14116.1 ParB/RepB/Spo0J family partition protein [Methylocystis sp. MJC1]
MTTKKQSESTKEPVTAIRLCQLRPDPKNVRRHESDAGIEGFAATIQTAGLLQNLTVRRPRPGEKAPKNCYFVTAGNRRLKALNLLKSKKASVDGVPVTVDFFVRVREIDETAASATEVSLIENTSREDMHPADAIEAYGRLAREEGLTPEAIADRHGVSHMTVRRRLKLANVSPNLLAELRKDAITLEQLQALALTDDHAAQEAAWSDAQEWQRDPDELRAALSSEAALASDKMARFVTVEVYEQQGGAVLRDLFDDDESRIRLTDRALLHRLAAEKLEQEAEAVRGEGWKWVETATEYNYHSGGLSRIYPKEMDPSPEDATRIDAIDTRLQEIEIEAESIEDDAAENRLFKERDDLEDERAAIMDQYTAYDSAEMATAGAIVTIDYNGALRIERGVVKPGDRKEAARLANGSTGAADEAPAANLTDALLFDLTTTRSAALACELAKRPDVALAALVHNLALDAFYRQSYASSLGLRAGVPVRTLKADDPANAKPFETLDALAADWRAKLPSRAADLWAWCLDAKPQELSNLMAYLVAAQIDAAKRPYADQIAQAIDFDMADYWRPSKDFGKRVSKKYMADALREAGRQEWEAKNILDVQKADAVSLFVEKMKDARWLPGPLKTTLAPANDIEGDDDAEADDERADDEPFPLAAE